MSGSLPGDALGRLGLEPRIVCAAARTTPSPTASERLVAGLGAGPDWKRLWDVAHRHEVVALVAGPIERAAMRADVAVPSSWTSDAQRRAAATLVRTTTQAAVLGRVIDALAAEGVDGIPVKGISTALRWYGGLGTRPGADVDVLVRREDLPRARRALVAAGLERPANDYFAAVVHEYHDPRWVAVGPSGTVTVELHWALWSKHGFGLGPAALWAGATRGTLLGRDVLLLSPPDALLHMAIHRTRSALRLRWIVDVAELVRAESPTLDWDRVVRRAEEARARTATWAVLDLASTLLDAPVPPEVLAGLSPGRAKRIVLERTCGVTAMFRPRPVTDVRQRPSLTLRLLEQDGTVHIAKSLARSVRRSVRRILHESGIRRLPARAAIRRPGS